MTEPKLRFKVTLFSQEGGGSGAAWRAPFDVQETFQTRARVPVRGTINGFPFRSSLMPMGACHRMVVNKALREGGRYRRNRDGTRRGRENHRTAASSQKRVSEKLRLRMPTGRNWRSLTRKRWRRLSSERSRKKRAAGAWRRSCRL